MKSKLFCISAIILLLGVVACSADSLAELCPAEPVAVQQETPAAFSAITRENAHQVTRLQCIETSTTDAIAIASNGSMLAVASPGKIRIYDLPNLTLLQDLRQHTGIVRDLSWHPDSNLLASGGQDGSIVIWDMVDGQAQHILREHTDEVRALAWSLDGTRLASVGWDYMLRVWNVAEERHQEVNTGSVASIVWLNDDLLASGASVGHVSMV